MVVVKVLGKYQDPAVCPKCGHTAAISIYLNDKDCIKRECNRCNYTWLEEPLDKGKI